MEYRNAKYANASGLVDCRQTLLDLLQQDVVKSGVIWPTKPA